MRFVERANIFQCVCQSAAVVACFMSGMKGEEQAVRHEMFTEMPLILRFRFPKERMLFSSALRRAKNSRELRS